MSARDAMRKLVTLGLSGHDDGRRLRRVPGTRCREAPIEEGAVCRLVLERTPPAAPARVGRSHDVGRPARGASRGRSDSSRPRITCADASDAVVTGIAYDSRRVAAGHVFVALKGLHADGTSFARQAIDRGAVGVVSEQPAPAGTAVPWVVVERRAAALWRSSRPRSHGHPSREMQVVGITGTNGKTTTAYLMASIFEAASVRCGVLGTVGYRIGDEIRDATHTTPEAPEVQGLLREMVDRGCGACAMEVSSHALVASSRGRHDVRRRRLHQPDARPPRFPRRHGGVLSGQAAAVRDAPARRAEPDQPRRSSRRRRSSRSPAGP